MVRLSLAVVLAASVAGAALAQTPAASPPGPTPFASLLLSGLHAERQRDATIAADRFLEALVAAPDNRDLKQRAFLAALMDGRWARAIALAGPLQTEAPFPEAALALAVEAARSGDATALQQALQRLEQGLGPPRGAFGPDMRRQQTRLIAIRLTRAILRAWAEGGVKSGEEEAALSDLAEPLAPFRFLHLGLIRDWKGEHDAAEAAYRSAIAAQQRPSWRLVERLAQFLERRGRSAEAVELYLAARAQGTDPDLVDPALARARSGGPPPAGVTRLADGVAEGLYDLATLLQQDEAGNDLALLLTRMALALQPANPAAVFLLGDVLEDRGQRLKANEVFASIPHGVAVRWSARLKIAANRAELDDVDGAATELTALAAERPERDDPLARLGDLYRTKERWQEAIDAYTNALARIGTPTQRHWFLLFTRGIAFERSKQWPKAEADFKKALELLPDQPMVLNYLGYSWIDQGVNLEEGKRMVERAVELRPRDGHIVDSLGWAYYRLGDYPRAVEWLERAVELKPTEAVILDHLGDALWKVGRQLEARFQWRRALSFDPEPDVKQAIERKLEKGLE
ncbi:MAG: tetratricopeptide repeat protein [Alphaproteobacteria bacterium]|nr:tetratricopeptide repeat protein [Alphaproteobacteria bacterium]